MNTESNQHAVRKQFFSGLLVGDAGAVAVADDEADEAGEDVFGKGGRKAQDVGRKRQ